MGQSLLTERLEHFSAQIFGAGDERQVLASLPVVFTERLAWVPVTVWPEVVVLSHLPRVSMAAACLAP